MTVNCRGYNLVEVLVTLTIASIITITLVNFVNDIDMRHKVTIARADVNRIAEAAHLAEAEMSNLTTLPGQSLSILNLTTSSRLAWSLSSKLLELPAEDPWGNRFVWGGSDNGYVRVTDSTPAIWLATAPSPYIIDEGLGRVVSAGPDGVVDTRIGQDPADSESDIVVEYRHKPWLFYNVGGRMFVNSADGGASPESRAGIEMGAGTNAQVSPDGLRFAAVSPSNILSLGTLTWALETEGAAPVPRTDPIKVAPRARTMSFTQNQWTTDTTPIAINGGTFPVWLPDSSGIVFQSGGDLYRFDAARGLRTGDERGEVIKLTDQTKLGFVTGATGSSRVIYSTRRNASYIDKDAGIFIAISGDGKVAFRDAAGGISLALGDGTARHTMKAGGDLAPLAWLDNNNVAYWDRAGKRLWRIAQDGTIDVPLHENTKPTIDGVLNAVLSPDGKYLALLQDDSKGNVAKTDGTGFVASMNNSAKLNFDGVGLKAAPPIVWRGAVDCQGNRLFYLPSSDTSKPVQSQRLQSGDTFLYNAESITAPEDCKEGASHESPQSSLLAQMNVLYYDLSRDEKMLVVVSDRDSKDRPSGGKGGVFVVPLNGTSKGMTIITPTVPISGSTYNYVSWLLN
ncbi:MAG: prepilin-type N-terminal cleavage/methylation domain-containing protein [Candidatus Wallbacteria bacterium]|nr:prepilin-type N-terminal cleavage/methylation domain-containing protein [Candidatus Wallbacteria bacterium]